MELRIRNKLIQEPIINILRQAQKELNNGKLKDIEDKHNGKHHSEKTKKEASARMLENNPFKGKHHKPEDLKRAVETRRKNGSYGPRIWVNNGSNNKFINPDELKMYEQKGT